MALVDRQAAMVVVMNQHSSEDERRFCHVVQCSVCGRSTVQLHVERPPPPPKHLTQALKMIRELRMTVQVGPEYLRFISSSSRRGSDAARCLVTLLCAFAISLPLQKAEKRTVHQHERPEVGVLM